MKEAIGNTRAAAMDVMAARTGFVYGHATAQAYIASGMAKHVLIIGAETLTRSLDYTDRDTCVLFGDGAGALVLSAADASGGTLSVELTMEPEGAFNIWIRTEDSWSISLSTISSSCSRAPAASGAAKIVRMAAHGGPHDPPQQPGDQAPHRRGGHLPR